MSQQTNDEIVVLMTAPNAEEGTRIAEMLVERKLAACVQILPPMTSIYVWKGEVQRESEILLVAKSSRAKFDELEEAVRAIHSYETPEIIALPIVAGSQPYLSWLSDCLEGS
ncbi:MAG TPA: divalent-cation tolerance protein CutA [Pyrinomonadaceae bacterium]|nr:divalent-cation tolerance protein CutA [Pyrinomonadaceae bacterium]